MNIKKYVFQKAAINHIPVSGTFELTPRCNLSCEMCYIRMSTAEEAIMGTELTTEEWLFRGKQAVDAGMVYLLITGGEPLLREDFTDIYTSMAKMGVIMSLNTNATLVSENVVKCFVEHPPERINVTLYGASADTYEKVCGNAAGYRAAFQGVRMLKDSGLPVCINTTFTRNNATDMEDIVAFAKKNNIPIRMTSYLFPPVRCGRKENSTCVLTPEEHGKLGAAFDSITMDSNRRQRRAEILANISADAVAQPQESRAAKCMAGRSAFWITWDGHMLPCGMLPHLGTSLRKANFTQIWTDFGQTIKAQMLPEKCSSCAKKILCPVCIAVTQSQNVVPDALCRYCDSYMAEFSTIIKNKI